MSDVFISHVKEDSDTAQEIARGLESAGYTTWYYERDSVAGVSYLLTTKRAIEESRAVLVIISSASLGAPQMTKEVVRAHESDKPFIPLLRGVTHDEFQQRQPEWREAMGAAASLEIPPMGVSAILPRIADGLKALGIPPKSPEERAAEARARERAQRLEAMLMQADQASKAADWDKAVAALTEYVSVAPGNKGIQDRLLEAQQRQRESRLQAFKAQAGSLAKAEKWDGALSAWREYLALEPQDKAAAQAEMQRIERLRATARAYAEAQAAIVRKEYDRAIGLLKPIVMQDETYKDASRLLTNAIERRRTGGRSALPKWLWAGLAAVALIAAAVLVVQTLRSAIARKPTVTASPTPGPTAVVASAPTPTAARMASAVAQATRTPSPRPTSGAVSPTRTSRPTLTATPKQPAVTPTPSLAGAGTERTVLVPDAVVGEFYSPGPSPAGLVAASGHLWVADGEQHLLYQLDRAGAPVASFPITFTNQIQGLDWDGEALRLALYSDWQTQLIVRLSLDGTVLGSFSQSHPQQSQQVLNPADGSLWQYRDGFLVQFGADGKLVQTFPVSVWGSVEYLAMAPDALWLTATFGDCYHYSFEGELLYSSKLPGGTFPYRPGAMTFDEQGYLWLMWSSGRKIYQISLRSERVSPMPTATPKPGAAGELALPRPQIRPATVTNVAIVYVTNELQGPMTVSFRGQSAIVKQGDTWRVELEEGVYGIFASTNVPSPIAYSGNELLLSGYEYSWVLRRPE
jgi:tetratricopeptide (TPR) repeat protein